MDLNGNVSSTSEDNYRLRWDMVLFDFPHFCRVYRKRDTHMDYIFIVRGWRKRGSSACLLGFAVFSLFHYGNARQQSTTNYVRIDVRGSWAIHFFIPTSLQTLRKRKHPTVRKPYVLPFCFLCPAISKRKRYQNWASKKEVLIIVQLLTERKEWHSLLCRELVKQWLNQRKTL